MKRLLFTGYLGLMLAAACSDDESDGTPDAMAGAGANLAGSPESGGGDSSSAGEPTDSGGAAVAAGAGGSPVSTAGGGEGGQAEPEPTAGMPGTGGDALEGCMTSTPGLVDYCADQPKPNAIYCPSPAAAPFADCDVSPGSPLNFDGWCCETAACVRATSLDAICGVLAAGKTKGYTCHAEATAPSPACQRTADGACCP